MSELYAVSVEQVDGDTIDFDVSVVHPDAGPVPDQKTFAFRILFDPVIDYSYKNEPSVKNSPLAKEMDLDDFLNEGFIDANAQGFIASTEIIAEDHHPPPSWNDPNYEDFWDYDSPDFVNPSATLRVKVTHPGWAAHLTSGMSFGTASYGSGDGQPWDGPTREPGDFVEEVSEDPMEGMRERTKEDDQLKDYGADSPADTFIIPVFGEAHYTTKEELSGEDVTAEALREMIGIPVKLVGEFFGSTEMVGTILTVSEEGMVTVYHEARDGGSYGTRGSRVGSIERIGRAWYVRRVRADDVEV